MTADKPLGPPPQHVEMSLSMPGGTRHYAGYDEYFYWRRRAEAAEKLLKRAEVTMGWTRLSDDIRKHFAETQEKP